MKPNLSRHLIMLATFFSAFAMTHDATAQIGRGIGTQQQTQIRRGSLSGVQAIRCASGYSSTPVILARYFNDIVLFEGGATLAVDGEGNVYYIDQERKLRKIAPGGANTIVADLTEYLDGMVEASDRLRPVALAYYRGDFYFVGKGIPTGGASQTPIYRLRPDGTVSAIFRDVTWAITDLHVDSLGLFFLMKSGTSVTGYRGEVHRISINLDTIEEPLRLAETGTVFTSDDLGTQTTMTLKRRDVFYASGNDVFTDVIHRWRWSGSDEIIVGPGSTSLSEIEEVGGTLTATSLDGDGFTDMAFDQCGHLYFAEPATSSVYRLSPSFDDATLMLRSAPAANQHPLSLIVDRSNNLFAVLCHEGGGSIGGVGPCDIVKFSPTY